MVDRRGDKLSTGNYQEVELEFEVQPDQGKTKVVGDWVQVLSQLTSHGSRVRRKWLCGRVVMLALIVWYDTFVLVSTFGLNVDFYIFCVIVLRKKKHVYERRFFRKKLIGIAISKTLVCIGVVPRLQGKYVCMLMTYENFRYHYDKKDNPYNKGSWGNIKDVFFTKIPPSLNDFRSWVQEEIVEDGSFTSDIGMLVNNSKKLDIDMGGKPISASGLSIPSILQNIDYNSTDDNSSDKGSFKGDLINPFATPVIQELTTEAPRDGNQSYATDGQVVDEGAEKTTLQNFIDDNLSDKDKHKEYLINPFANNVIQESIAQESRDCTQRCIEDGQVVDQGADQMILNETAGEYFFFVEESPDRCSCPSEALHPVDQDIHRLQT